MTLNMPYEEVIKRIISETELSKEEVIKRIDEKVEELGGLITLEGAAHIIARELEINLYDSQQIKKLPPTKIQDLIDGMNNVSLTALVKTVYDPKSFTRNDGSQGAVQNVQLADKTGFCRFVLWDDQIRQFKDYGILSGKIIRITSAFVKESKFDKVKELSLSSRSQIETDLKDIKKEDFPKSLLEKDKIKNIKLGQIDLELIGEITAIRPASQFTKKDGSEGHVASFEIADETGKIRITLWDDMANEISTHKIGEIVEVVGGYTRKGLNDNIEIHLGKNGTINNIPNISLNIPKEILESESTISSTVKKSTIPSKEMRLADLSEGMSNISLIARITGISNIRGFERKDGSSSVVGSLAIEDNSGPGRITFWNSSTDYIKKVQIGDVIRIQGAYTKLGLHGDPEVHVSKDSNIEINPEYLKEAIPELVLEYYTLASLKPNMKDINVKAMITRVQEIRTFSKKDGTEGHVLNMGISDSTGSVQLVVWDDKAIELEHLEEMNPVEILHGYTKEGQLGIELHLGTLSTVRKLKKNESAELINIIQSNASDSSHLARVDMVNLEEDQFSEIRGTILKVYEGKMFYYSCPSCRKKIVESDEDKWECNEHGLVTPQQTIFLSLALDDGTGCVRVTFFRELAEHLLDISSETLIDEIENVGIQTTILKLEQKLKGREIIVRGRCKKNKYDDGMDIIATSYFDMDVKSEIELVKDSLNV